MKSPNPEAYSGLSQTSKLELSHDFQALAILAKAPCYMINGVLNSPPMSMSFITLSTSDSILIAYVEEHYQLPKNYFHRARQI